MITLLKRFTNEEDGATMLEYAIMLALLGAAMVTSVSALASSVSGKFTSASATISGS